MAILGNTTINGSLNINGVPVEPGSGSGSAGTLKTDNSSSLSVATESLGGTVNLHKISKTGTYTDLISVPKLKTDAVDTLTPSNSVGENISGTIALQRVSKTGKYSDLYSGVVALMAASGNVSGTYNSGTGSFTLSPGAWFQAYQDEGADYPKTPNKLGTLLLLPKQTVPAENGLYRLIAYGTDVLFEKVTDQDSVIIGYGFNAGRTFSKLYNDTWVASPKTTFATTDTVATDPLYEGDIVLIYS